MAMVMAHSPHPDLNDYIGFIADWNAVVVGMLLVGLGALMGLVTVSRHGRLYGTVTAMRASVDSCHARIRSHILFTRPGGRLSSLVNLQGSDLVTRHQQRCIQRLERAEATAVQWLEKKLNVPEGSPLVTRPVMGVPIRLWYYAWMKLVLEDRLRLAAGEITWRGETRDET
ncbi:hypothetical protein EXIGLDRAFT_701875 [Exidia glandulosa HHB12029]|uniref:Uncharacterized protein n=1 Tax=Exidia glandulosa HHB12029 TaxID=1314781 RepID=A0A165CTS5_EXIGL|nr:hypothetical protein EXIGLDRAFT_701875 [Exidia glandulosa HHB12029]